MRNAFDHAILKIFLLSLTAFFLQGCGKAKFVPPDLANNILGTPGGGGGGENGNGNPNKTCFDEEFQQPDQSVNKKVDILIVTDTSGSLNRERQAVANGITSFTSALGADVDYQVAVMLSHGDYSVHAGELYQSHLGEPVVLRSNIHSSSQVQTFLNAKLTNVVEDFDTDGGEAGLFSLSLALKDPKLTSHRNNHQFFRTDAALAVVFISDENDICVRGAIPDPQGKEIPAFNRLCKDKVTPASVYNQLLTLQNTSNQSLVVGAAIYDNPATVISNGENEVGFGYTDIVSLNNGLSVDIAQTSATIAAGLSSIGDLTSVRLELLTEFILNRTDMDQTTLKVFVDGVQIPYAFSPATGSIQISEFNAGGALSEVLVNYCLPPEEE